MCPLSGTIAVLHTKRGDMAEKRDMLDDLIDIQRDWKAVPNPLGDLADSLVDPDKAHGLQPGRLQGAPARQLRVLHARRLGGRRGLPRGAWTCAPWMPSPSRRTPSRSLTTAASAACVARVPNRGLPAAQAHVAPALRQDCAHRKHLRAVLRDLHARPGTLPQRQRGRAALRGRHDGRAVVLAAGGLRQHQRLPARGHLRQMPHHHRRGDVCERDRRRRRS